MYTEVEDLWYILYFTLQMYTVLHLVWVVPWIWLDALSVRVASLEETSSAQDVAEARTTDEAYPLTHDIDQLLYHLLSDVYQPKH